MIVLADNDIVIKLAACDLFAEFQTAFGVTPVDIQIVNTARHSLAAKRIRKRLGDDGYQRLTAFLATVVDIMVSPDIDAIIALTEQPRIDEGEAVLFAVCPAIPDAVLVTGDKRSLVALTEASGDPVCARLCENLAGKVYCFEQVLFRILETSGFDAIRDRLIRGRECDGGLALWLGSGLDANTAAFSEGLNSFLDEVRRNTGALLAT